MKKSNLSFKKEEKFVQEIQVSSKETTAIVEVQDLTSATEPHHPETVTGGK